MTMYIYRYEAGYIVSDEPVQGKGEDFLSRALLNRI